MRKVIMGIAAVALISTSANSAFFQSKARTDRGFSCTKDCTGVINCDNLKKCKAPASKCTEKGGLLSRIKGRKTKVDEAIGNAENKCLVSQGGILPDKQQGQIPVQPKQEIAPMRRPSGTMPVATPQPRVSIPKQPQMEILEPQGADIQPEAEQIIAPVRRPSGAASIAKPQPRVSIPKQPRMEAIEPQGAEIQPEAEKIVAPVRRPSRSMSLTRTQPIDPVMQQPAEEEMMPVAKNRPGPGSKGKPAAAPLPPPMKQTVVPTAKPLGKGNDLKSRIEGGVQLRKVEEVEKAKKPDLMSDLRKGRQLNKVDVKKAEPINKTPMQSALVDAYENMNIGHSDEPEAGPTNKGEWDQEVNEPEAPVFQAQRKASVATPIRKPSTAKQVYKETSPEEKAAALKAQEEQGNALMDNLSSRRKAFVDQPDEGDDW